MMAQDERYGIIKVIIIHPEGDMNIIHSFYSKSEIYKCEHQGGAKVKISESPKIIRMYRLGTINI